MIFVLDNYDSFTYNLVQMLGEMGAKLEVARNDEITVPEIESLRPRALVLSPGPGRPEKAGILLETIRHFAGKLPMLGVCLGHQGIGQVFGARVVRATELVHGKATEILHDGKTIFEDLPGKLEAGRYHSLVIDPGSVPTSLKVTARTAAGVVMGLRHKKYPMEGVQFHPESILTGTGARLLGNFLRMTRRMT